MTEIIRSGRGRALFLVGNTALLTEERRAEFMTRLDSDPRIASLSLVPLSGCPGEWLRGSAPTGPLIAVASDLEDLLGPLDAADPATLVAWMRRASQRGLWHDWWITDDADVMLAEALLAPAAIDSLEIDDSSSAHHAAIRRYQPRPDPLRVAVDVTWLRPQQTGSQVLTTEALNALAKQQSVAEIWLFGLDELPAYANHLLADPKIHMVDVAEKLPICDVAWFPYHPAGVSPIAEARRLAERVVTTCLDLIAYDVVSYHRSEQEWERFRSLQRRAALYVDGVVTISADVATRLLSEVPLIDRKRVLPLPLGLDHLTFEHAPDTPDSDLHGLVRVLGGRRFVLVLGNDFHHKNRDFAIKVWERVLQEGPSCDLVLVGMHVSNKSSQSAEDNLIGSHTDERGTVYRVGHVSTTSRTWLLANAAVVHYPTSAEGFGFIPYEAAAMGTPSVFTDFGPLNEIAQLRGLPRGWSVEQHASDLVSLLSDETESARRVAGLREAVTRYTWDGFAARLVEFFRTVDRLPEVAVSTPDTDSAAALAAVLSSSSWRATEPFRVLARRMKKVRRAFGQRHD